VPNRVGIDDFSRHVDNFRRIKAFEAVENPRFETNVESRRMRIAAQQSRSAIDSSNSSPKVSSSVFDRLSSRRSLLSSNSVSPLHASSLRASHGQLDDDIGVPTTISSSTSVNYLALAEALIATTENAGWNTAYQAATVEGSTWLERQRMRERQMRRWAAAAEACACTVRVSDAILAERQLAVNRGAAALDEGSAEDDGFTLLVRSLKFQALAAETQLQDYAKADVKQRSAEEAEEAAKGAELAATLEAANLAHAEATAASKKSDIADAPLEPPELSSPKAQALGVPLEAWNDVEETTAALFAAQRVYDAHTTKAKRAAEIRRPAQVVALMPTLLSMKAREYCAEVAAESVASRAFAADRAMSSVNSE